MEIRLLSCSDSPFTLREASLLPNPTIADQLLASIFLRRLRGDYRQTHSSLPKPAQTKTTNNMPIFCDLFIDIYQLFRADAPLVGEASSRRMRHISQIQTNSCNTFPRSCSAITAIRTVHARTSTLRKNLSCKASFRFCM